MARGLGKIQKKVLALICGGVALACTPSPQGQLTILRKLRKEWKEIDRKALHKAIRALYKSHLVDFRERGNGNVEMTLTKEGKKRVVSHNLDTLNIKKPARWDGKWRIVCFDIPKEEKKAREALRFHLRRLGFHPFQKSVFVFPYACENEIDFLIECYEMRPYVRKIVAQEIDNAPHLKQIFDL